MRVSLASRCEMTSLCAGSPTNRFCQQPGPNGVDMVVSLMHWPSGKSPAFWLALGGTAYRPTVSVVLERLSAGLALLSDLVLLSAQTSKLVEEPSPLASSAALDDRKYSVPPCALAYWLPGLSAG